MLLTSEVTVSAGEIFTMAMRALPSVTHIGEATSGALSDILPKPLPNGWSLRLSHEIYEDGYRILWEGRGVEPEREERVLIPERIDESHLELLRRLGDELGSSNR